MIQFQRILFLRCIINEMDMDWYTKNGYCWKNKWRLKMIHLPLHRTCSCVCVLKWRTEQSTLCISEHFLISACAVVFCLFQSRVVVECLYRHGVTTSWCTETWWHGTGTLATPPSPAWSRCTAPRSSGRPWRRRCWRWRGCPPPTPAGCPPQTWPWGWTAEWGLRSWIFLESTAIAGHWAASITNVVLSCNNCAMKIPTYQEQISILMVPRSGWNFDNFPLLQYFSGRWHEVNTSSYWFLNFQQFLKLFYSLHGVIGVSGCLWHLE